MRDYKGLPEPEPDLETKIISWVLAILAVVLLYVSLILGFSYFGG